MPPSFGENPLILDYEIWPQKTRNMTILHCTKYFNMNCLGANHECKIWTARITIATACIARCKIFLNELGVT